MAGDQFVHHGLAEAGDDGGDAVCAVDAMGGVGQIGTGNDGAGADLEPAEDVFGRDGLDGFGHAGIDEDEAAVAVGAGDGLHVGVERGEGGDTFVEEFAEDGVDLEFAIAVDETGDGLGREALELGDFVVGQKGEHLLGLAVSFDGDHAHSEIVSC